MNQENTNGKELCAFCNKSFKRIKTHKCKMNNNGVAAATASLPNQDTNNIVMMMGTMMTQLVQVFQNGQEAEAKRRAEEREEEAKRRAEEREVEAKRRAEEREAEAKRRKEEREEDRLIRREERQEDMKFQMMILTANHEFKERMLNKKIEAAERSTQKYIDAMYGTVRQERQRLDDFHQRQIKYTTDSNNQNRRLSIAPADIHQKDELVVYGTPALPLVKYEDAKGVIDNVVFEPQVLQMFAHPPDLEEQKMEDEVRESVHETLSACAVETSYLADGKIHKDRFIELRALDRLVSEFEKDANLEPRVYQSHMSDMNKHMPYSPYFGCEVLSEKEFEKKFREDDYDMMGEEDLFEVVREENIEKPHRIIEEIKAIDVEDLKEEEEEGQSPEEEVVLEWGSSLSEKEVVGVYDDTPSSLKNFLQKKRKLREQFVIFFDRLGKTETGRFRRNMRLQGMARLRCRLVVIKTKLRNTGAYVPDFMDRYLNDQLFQQKNIDLEPHARKPKTCFMKNRKGFVCTHCLTPLHDQNFEKGHVVPSKGKTTGSNFWYNIISLCVKCNTRMGAKDAYLDTEFRITNTFV